MTQADLQEETAQTGTTIDVLSQDEVAALHVAFNVNLRMRAIEIAPKAEHDADLLCAVQDFLLMAAHARLKNINYDHITHLAQDGSAALVRDFTRDTKAAFMTSDDGLMWGIKQEGAAFTALEQRDIDKAARKRSDYPAIENLFKGEERLYLEIAATKSDAQDSVEQRLRENGYRVTDYKKGYATDARGNTQFRIGKLLRKCAPELLTAFQDDTTRIADSDMMVVLSRRADDIANMSTNRNWGSCMSAAGPNFNYVAKDIRYGSVIAYLVRKDDPDVTDPIARIMLKPWVPKNPIARMFNFASKLRGEPEKANVVFIPDKVYGIDNALFSETVAQVAAQLSGRRSGKYLLPEDLYQNHQNQDGTPAHVATVQQGRLAALTYRY